MKRTIDARAAHPAGGAAMPFAPAATVVAIYVCVDSTRWFPVHGAAFKVAYFLIVGSVMIAAIIKSGRSTSPPERLRWLRWLPAQRGDLPNVLGAVPLVALAAGPVGQWVVERLIDVGPRGTYNDIPPNPSTGDRWMYWLASVVGAVLIEELVYRGALISIAARISGRAWFAVAVSSLAWGLAHGGFEHGYNAAQVAGIAVEGVVTGAACWRYRSLLPGLAAHALGNLDAARDDHITPTVAAFLIAYIAAGILALLALRTSYKKRMATIAARQTDNSDTQPRRKGRFARRR